MRADRAAATALVVRHESVAAFAGLTTARCATFGRSGLAVRRFAAVRLGPTGVAGTTGVAGATRGIASFAGFSGRAGLATLAAFSGLTAFSAAALDDTDSAVCDRSSPTCDIDWPV